MVTYGDMVTLLLTFFVMVYAAGKATPQEIMIILSAFKSSLGFFDGGQTLSKGKLEEMGMTLESLPANAQGRSLSRAKKQARDIFKPEIKAKKINITEDERGLVISLIGMDYFEPGSAAITPALEKVLDKSALLFRELDRFIRIEGHASGGEGSVLTGGEDLVRSERVYMNSWDLAGARSIQVSTYLQDQGVRPSLLQAVSYGSYRPIVTYADQGTPEAAAHNRRVDLVIQPTKRPTRAASESGYGLPSSRLPGNENRMPDY